MASSIFSSIWRQLTRFISSFGRSTSDCYPSFPWNDHINDPALQLPQNVTSIGSFKREEGIVNCMAVSSEGLIYMGCSDENVWGWNKCAGFGGFTAVGGPVYAIAVDPSGCIILCHHDGKIRLWVKISDGAPQFMQLRTLQTVINQMMDALRRKEFHFWNFFTRRAMITCIALSEDMKFLYSGSTDHTMYVWRLEDGKLVDSRTEHEETVSAVAAGCDRVVFSASDDGSLIMWRREDEANGVGIQHLCVQFLLSTPDASSVKTLLLKSNGTNTGELYAGLSDGRVMFWKETTHWLVAQELLPPHGEAVTCLARSPGPLVFSGSQDKKIFAWRRDPDNGHHVLVMELRGHESPINCIAAREDWEENDDGPGRCILYSSSEDKVLKIWRIADAAPGNAQEIH